MNNFKIGDRVVVTQNSSIMEYNDLKGLHGTIVNVRGSCAPYAVTLDDRQHSSNTNGMYYFDDSELAFESHTQPCYYATVDCSLSNTGKEKKEMELLELYFNRKRDELEVKYREKREKIKRKDVMYTEVMDLRKKYAHIAEFNIYVTNVYKFSTEIENEIIKNDREYDKKLDELYYQRQEIKAQLDICETYEQKMNVLKAYGVVDEQGKLNK